MEINFRVKTLAEKLKEQEMENADSGFPDDNNEASQEDPENQEGAENEEEKKSNAEEESKDPQLAAKNAS